MLAEFTNRIAIDWYDEEPALVEDLVAILSNDIKAIVAQKDSFTLALSGGNSPKPLFHVLAKDPMIPWQQGTLTLIDERWVPATANDSNEKLLSEHLLTDHAATARLVPLYDGESSIEDRIRALNKTPTWIDIGVLGMGMDGHTASLFPCSPEFADNLATADNYVIASPQTAGHQRISLSGHALLQIPLLYLFVPGEAKFKRLQEILAGQDTRSPIYWLLTHSDTREHPIRVFSCS